MKTLKGWRAIAAALKVSMPTAMKIAKRDKAVKRIIHFEGPHPCATLRELRAAVDGRSLVMKRGRKKLY